MIRAKLSVADAATPRLREIAEQLARPVALYKDVGRRLTKELRANFVALDAAQSPKHGALSTHFWTDVRNATQNPEADPQGVSVTIAHPAFAQKLFGGTIRAKNGRALTIPIHPLAHGRRASVFEDETGFKLFRPKGKRLLMADIDGEPTPIYALATSVTQSPEPKALPPENELRKALLDTAEKHLEKRLARR